MRVLTNYKPKNDAEYGAAWGLSGVLDEMQGYFKPSSIDETEKLDSLNRILAHLLQMGLVTHDNGITRVDLCPLGSREGAEVNPEVREFIESKGLNGILSDVRKHLSEAFGSNLQLNYNLSTDPEDGSEMLYINILTDDIRGATRKIAKFRHSWWYDQLGVAGSLVAFRAVKPRGV